METIKRILIVDDEKDISLIFKSGLERKGFAVDVSNDPLEALSRFKADYYDLLLLDVRMPRMNGFELWTELRKKDQRCKVCFVSAFEIHEDEFKKYLPEEKDSCIVKKPVTIKELVNAVNEKLAEPQ